MSDKLNFIFKFWFPVIAWCALIYYFSSVPDLKSSLPNRWDFILRKLAHMAEYGILTFLSFRASAQNLSRGKALVFSIIFSITYSFTDEYHQFFVQGRSGSPVDILIDSVGVIFAALLIDKRVVNVSIKS